MSAEEAKKVSLGKLPWDGIAAFFGTVSGLSFFLSLVFDMGYFSTLGLSFAEVPTSIGDHVRSALLWVPEAVVAIFGYAVLTLAQWMIADVMAQHKQTNNREEPLITPKIWQWIYRSLFYIAFLAFWIDILSGGGLGKYGAAATPIVVLYIAWDIVSRTQSTKRINPATILATIAFAAIALIIFYQGVGRATAEREHPRMATITFDGSKELHLIIYRFLENGVLTSNGQGQYVFYRWEDIKAVRASLNTPKRTNWLCKSLGFACAHLNQPITPDPEPRQ